MVASDVGYANLVVEFRVPEAALPTVISSLPCRRWYVGAGPNAGSSSYQVGDSAGKPVDVAVSSSAAPDYRHNPTPMNPLHQPSKRRSLGAGPLSIIHPPGRRVPFSSAPGAFPRPAQPIRAGTDPDTWPCRMGGAGLF